MRVFLLTISLLLLGVAPAAYAAPTPDMELIVEADFEPTQAVGLLITEKGSTPKEQAKFTKLENGKFLVSFPLSAAELKSSGTATAILYDTAGHSAYGEVREIAREGLRPAPIGMSECKEKGSIPTTLQGQLALLESLVGIRSQRREVLQEALKSEFSGDMLERLQRLEDGFGLKSASELSPSLAPYQLVERLSAIVASIKNVRANKARRDAELRQTVAAPPVTEQAAEE